jgi:hypothetical protein
MNKLKIRAIGVAAGLILTVTPGVALAHNSNGNDNEHNRITICHATGSASNPFVEITVNANGIVHGHANHQNDNDIIPSFAYNDHGATLTFPAQGDQNILANGCKVTGGEGGGQMDCDNDFDNSPQSECTTPQPQKDCDNDFDNSPASECTTGQVLGATITPGQGAGPTQVAVVPQGSVNGGEGAASSSLSKASAIGLFSSLLSAGAGLALFNRRQG